MSTCVSTAIVVESVAAGLREVHAGPAALRDGLVDGVYALTLLLSYKPQRCLETPKVHAPFARSASVPSQHLNDDVICISTSKSPVQEATVLADLYELAFVELRLFPFAEHVEDSGDFLVQARTLLKYGCC